jgi:DNA (cytosine-5)-methyltransferase 1
MTATEGPPAHNRAVEPTFTLVDLFAGVGGFTLGFLDRSANPRCRFVPKLLVDIDQTARDVARRNLPSVPYVSADISSLSGSQIRARAGIGPRDPVHVLCGGPPCQGFSWLGRRALDDERNVHLVDFLRAVKELRPLVAVMENVPLIITSHGGGIIRELCDSLEKLGYASAADIVIASDYGVPQLRKRALLVAYRADLGVPPQMPRRTHERIAIASQLAKSDAKPRLDETKAAYVSVQEAIGDLPSIEAGGGEEVMPYDLPPASDYQRWARGGSLALFNHRSRAHSAEFLAKIRLIAEGGRNQDLADEVRFSDNYYSQAYARLHRNGIGQTITTFFGNPGSGRFMHFRDLRSITVREAARFQSFPDAFVFDGKHSDQMRHVGNAMPPILARAIRDRIADDLLAAGVHQPRTPGRPKRSSAPPPEEPTALRSRIMRAVPSKNTSAELALRKALRAAGLRGYRLHSKRAPGNPDVLFPLERVAVFVDGCFWHGCPSCYRAPKARSEYWSIKVKRNKERDARVDAECRSLGWTVVRVWEHEIARSVRRVVARVDRRVGASRRASEVAPARGRASKPPARKKQGDLVAAKPAQRSLRKR